MYIVYVYICIYMQEKNLEGHDPLLIGVGLREVTGGIGMDALGNIYIYIFF